MSTALTIHFPVISFMAAAAVAAAAAAAASPSFVNPGRATKLYVNLPSPVSSIKLSPSTLPSLIRTVKRFFPRRPCSAAQVVEVEEKEELESSQYEEANQKKLYVVNLPWSYPASDLQNLFGQCGTVSSLEIIRKEDGRSKGFAFVTMASPEEAQGAIEKLNSSDLEGRLIRVELAKSFRKPSKQLPLSSIPTRETIHKIYVGNLHWKARAGNLREFFSAKFKPMSSRVVFENSGRSAGYGFVSFATEEEADTAVSELDGVELMGRPLRLRISQKKGNESETKQGGSTQGQAESP